MNQVADKISSYLDDQPWWQKTYWTVWRFWDNYNPRQLYREATYFIQRGRRGYSDRDLWNADYHIARTVMGFLDIERHTISFADHDPKVPWDKSLEVSKRNEAEIRWLMEQALNGWMSADFTDPKYRKRYDRANRLFGKYWMSMWD